MIPALRCFDATIPLDRLDRQPFVFGHRLLGHPSLTLENLSRVLPKLPKQQVMYSKSKLANGDDFEATFANRPEGVSVSEVLESIRTSQSYIMIRSPEAHLSFRQLYADLKGDILQLMRARGIPGPVEQAQLYLFIASPNAVTPFHIDRYSTMLLQFRGTKTVTVFPQWSEEVIRSTDREAYCDYHNTSLPWNPALDVHGNHFEFKPGDALHIPFIAGHHVANGADDVSISMSIIFNTRESLAWRYAMCMNHRLRRRVPGISRLLVPVGRAAWRDKAKASMFLRIGAVRQRMGKAW